VLDSVPTERFSPACWARRTLWANGARFGLIDDAREKYARGSTPFCTLVTLDS